MARFTTQLEVAAAPSTVFAYLEDFTNAAAWDPGVAGAARLDDGPIGLGSRFALDLAVGPTTQRWVYGVEEHVAPRRVVFVTTKPIATGVDSVTVEERPDGGSRVTWDATFRFTGLLGTIVDPVFGLAFDRIARKAVAGLGPALATLPAEDATA